METAALPMAMQSPIPCRGFSASLPAQPRPFACRWGHTEAKSRERDLRSPLAFFILALSASGYRADVRSRGRKQSAVSHRGNAVRLSSQSTSVAPVPPVSGGLRKLWSCATFSWVSALMRRGNRPPPIETLQLLPAPRDMPHVSKINS